MFFDVPVYAVMPESGLVVLGELGKWVPISAARISAIEDTKSFLRVSLVGVQKEVVGLAFAKGTTVIATTCTISASGEAIATFDGSSASCKSP